MFLLTSSLEKFLRFLLIRLDVLTAGADFLRDRLATRGDTRGEGGEGSSLEAVGSKSHSSRNFSGNFCARCASCVSCEKHKGRVRTALASCFSFASSVSKEWPRLLTPP